MINFELNEFDSPDDKGSGKYMDESFLSMLDDARGIAGIPFIINSGFRSKSHIMHMLEVKNQSKPSVWIRS